MSYTCLRDYGLLGKIENLWFGEPANSPKKSRIPVASPYISECIDESPQSWKRGVLMCFIEGPLNRQFFKDLATAEARQAHVVSFIGQAFNDTASAAGHLAVVEHNWASRTL